jgi:hypothetical protein
MPLTRFNDKAFAASMAGVAFNMTDGSRTVNCIVMYPALQDSSVPRPAPLGQVGESQMTCPKAFSGATEQIIAAAVNEFGAFEDAPKRQGGRP